MLEGKLATDTTASAVPAGRSPDRRVLASLALFQGIGVAALAELEQASRYRRFAADEVIFDRESASAEVYVVVRGRARALNFSMSGREIAFEDFVDGDLFGELSSIDGLPRPTSIVAVQESLTLVLPGKLFLATLAEHPAAACRLLQQLSRQLRAAQERIMDLSTLAANNRVHAELLRQARSQVGERNSAVIEPIPIHSDIASRVSTTRETVARVLNDLARKGIVERTRDALVIRNVRLLQSMVQEVRG